MCSGMSQHQNKVCNTAPSRNGSLSSMGHMPAMFTNTLRTRERVTAALPYTAHRSSPCKNNVLTVRSISDIRENEVVYEAKLCMMVFAKL